MLNVNCNSTLKIHYMEAVLDHFRAINVINENKFHVEMVKLNHKYDTVYKVLVRHREHTRNNTMQIISNIVYATTSPVDESLQLKKLLNVKD